MRNVMLSSSLHRVGMVVGTGILAFVCLTAQAQGPGGNRLSTEERAKAWELQAGAVAADAGLSAEETTKLVDAYKAARESQAAAMREKMTSGGGRPDPAAMAEVNKAERDKLQAALAAILKEDQVAKVIVPLGGFNRRWDSMTLTLEGLQLDAAKKAEASKLITAYIVESDKATQEAMAAGDWESLRTKGQALKEDLDSKLGKVLSEEQLGTWKQATAMRGGMGGGRQRQEGAPAAPAPPAK